MEEKKESTENAPEKPTVTTETVGVEDTRQPMIYLKDSKVNVTTLHLAMSQRHRITMLIDFLMIGMFPSITVYMSMLENLSISKLWIIIGGSVLTILALSKTAVDLMNWIFTMNIFLTRMGEWYMDDVVNLCRSLINAGATVVEEEVRKVLEGKVEQGVNDSKEAPKK